MQSPLKILAVIPARRNSKGVPNKNITVLRGQPLMHYAIKTALETSGISKVVVSTDSQQYADVARSCGAEVPFLRPEALGRDDVRLIAVMAHALKHFDGLGEVFDAVLSLQPTAPLTRSETLAAMIEKMERSGCESVATVAEVGREHPYIVQELHGTDGDQAKPFLSLPEGTPRYPRQVRPVLHVFTGAAFLRKRHLVERADPASNALGTAPRVVIVDPVESINIDTQTDLMLVDFYLSLRSESKPNG